LLQAEMFEARLVQRNLFKKVLESLVGLLNDDATLHCSDAGIMLQAMDPWKVSLISVHLHADGFTNYQCDKALIMGTNLHTMSQILRCAADDETITLKAGDTADVVTFVFESLNKNKVSEYEIYPLNLYQEHIRMCETDYTAVIKMPSGEFERVVRDFSQCDEAMVIACTRDGVKFSSTSDTGTWNIMIAKTANVEEEEAVIIEMQEPITLSFSCKYLHMFTKASVLGGQVSLSIAPDTPLVVEYSIGEIGHVKYYLAPKVEWEDMEDEDWEDLEDEESEDMEMKDVGVKTEYFEEDQGEEVKHEYIEVTEVVKFKMETELEFEKLQDENRKLKEENRKLKTENEALKLDKSECKPRIKQEESECKHEIKEVESECKPEIKQEEENKEHGEGRVDGQKNGGHGDEKKTDVVKSKAVKRKTKLIKTSSVNNNDDQDENQSGRGFSQDGRPDAKALRRSSRGLQGL